MINHETKILNSIENYDQSFHCALAFLKAEYPIALPTETVYGLAGDATSEKAISLIYQIKNRPRFNPLIAHVDGIEMAEKYCIIDPLSRQLMEIFWPGPLSFVLPLRINSKINHLASAGLKTLAVRCPCGIFKNIISHFGKPLVAPSANQSGRLSPTNAQAVYDDLKGKVPLIINGGSCVIGVESTIIKILENKAIMLRPGGVTRDEIESILNESFIENSNILNIESPGQLTSHYAPAAKIRLNAHEVFPNESLLLFGKQNIQKHGKIPYILNLSESGNLNEAALHLFSHLKRLDQPSIERIAVQTIPNIGLGEAINDRLARAAAPRS